MSGTRTLTVLFTDVVGSTELLAQLDARGSERLLSAHLRLLADQIERSGGTEIKNLGDGVMATFGSASDAIACGVAMQRASATPPPGAAVRVPVRVGLSSGDVRVEGGDCFGTAVVEASRLCAVAADGQVLASDPTRLLARDYRSLRAVGDLDLKGLPQPVMAWEAEWTVEAPAPVRVVLADDAALVREGVARVLEEAGLEVVAQAEDANELLEVTAELHPDVAVVDVRMPPTHTVEGLEAAIRIRAEHPQVGVLMLSQDMEPHYSSRLLAASPTHVGYLLKESVTRLSHFADAVRRVAEGGTAFEPGDGSDVPRHREIRELTPDEARALAGEVDS